MAVAEAGHRFRHRGLDAREEPEGQRNGHSGKRKKRGVLEPGGLNVERVRTLLRGDGCLVADDMDIRNACSDLMIGRSWVLREQHHCSWVQAPLLL